MTDEDGQPAEKSPVEQAVEVLVYAPIGLLFEGASILPQLVEKGRNQVSMARMIGKFAVEQGRGEASKAAGKVQDQAAGLLDLLGDTLAPLPAEARRPAAAPEVRADAEPPVRKTGKSEARSNGRTGRDRKATSSRAAATTVHAPALAIPDYDGLSASQVVNRLAGLSPAELEAVRAYEAANRGRKTILSKVAQLQSP